MPRGIGTRSGVKLTVTVPSTRAAEVLGDLGGVPVAAADAVRRDAAHHLAAEQVRLRGLAGAAGARGRDHDDVGLDEAGRDGRGEGERGDRRVAAGDRDPGGAGQLRALAGQLGQAVGPGPGVAAAVEPLPGRRVGEPVVGAAVDHHDLLPQLGRDRAGLAVRERQEDDVVPGQGLGVGLLEHPVGERDQVRLEAPSGSPALLPAGQRADLDLGVREQQAQQLTTGVPAGSGDGDLRDSCCMTIQMTVCASESSPRSPRNSGALRRWTVTSVAAMPRLEYPTYLDHIRTESARFRAALADCDPSARVPTCPDWDAADLLWHLAKVQLFWAKVIRHRPASPDDPEIGEEDAAQRPESYAELLDAFDDYSHALATELERAGPEAEAWHWSGDNRVGTSYRRQAHEARDPPDRRRADRRGGRHAAGRRAGRRRRGRGARGDVRRRAGVGLVHRVRRDDRGAHDRHRDRPAGRAREVLRHRPRRAARPTRTRTTSRSVDDGAEPVATVSGTAADLDTWLWKRDPALSPGSDEGDRIRIEGDRIAFEKLSAILGQPLN